MFRILLILILTGLPMISQGHNRRVASDNCHRSGETYHCHDPDRTITFASNQARYYEIAEVVDGDTIDFIYNEQGIIETRLYGIDSPETGKGTKLTNDAKMILKTKGIVKNHETYDTLLAAEKARQRQFGAAAKAFVEDTLEGRDVFVLFEDTATYPFIQQGRYGRYMAYIFYADTTGTRMLNLEMVAQGHADIDYLESPFRYRWAFIENLNEYRHLFAAATLPIKPVSLSPSQQRSTASLWAELKRRN